MDYDVGEVVVMKLSNLSKNWQEVIFPWEKVPVFENEALLDYHSLINILNLISMLLELYATDSELPPLSGIIQHQIKMIAKQINEDPEKAHEGVYACIKLNDNLDKLLEAMPASQTEQNEYSSILTKISADMRARVNDFLERNQNPDAWVIKQASDIQEQLKQFFSMVEENSRGRYQFVYNIAEQGPTAYMVSFIFEPDQHGNFEIPPVLLDSLRDLAANARKFTTPGGKITIKLQNAEGRILLEVEDNGLGIPPDEISKVVEYGFHASNTRNIRTMGGGFGLTKALSVATRYHGQMKIASALGKGTKISIMIPAKRNGSG